MSAMAALMSNCTQDHCRPPCCAAHYIHRNSKPYYSPSNYGEVENSPVCFRSQESDSPMTSPVLRMDVSQRLTQGPFCLLWWIRSRSIALCSRPSQIIHVCPAALGTRDLGRHMPLLTVGRFWNGGMRCSQVSRAGGLSHPSLGLLGAALWLRMVLARWGTRGRILHR